MCEARFMSLCGVTTTPSVPRRRRLVMTDNPSLTPFLYSLQPLVYSLWFPLLNADYWLLSSVLILHFFASPAHPPTRRFAPFSFS